MEVYILNAKKNNYRDQYSRNTTIYFTYVTLFYHYELKLNTSNKEFTSLWQSRILSRISYPKKKLIFRYNIHVLKFIKIKLKIKKHVWKKSHIDLKIFEIE